MAKLTLSLVRKGQHDVWKQQNKQSPGQSPISSFIFQEFLIIRPTWIPRSSARCATRSEGSNPGDPKRIVAVWSNVSKGVGESKVRMHTRWRNYKPKPSVELHFGSKKISKISIVFEDLSRIQSFLNRSETQIPHPSQQSSQFPRPRLPLGWHLRRRQIRCLGLRR